MGWNQPVLRGPQRRDRSTHRAWLLALLLVLTAAAAAWYFVLGDSAPSSAFVRAYDRYTTAAERVRVGATEVSRFLDLPEYEDMADRQLLVLDEQTNVFGRLARNEEGNAARIAQDAVAAAQRGRYAVYWYSRGVIGRRLSSARSWNTELDVAMTQLEELVDEWKKLSE